MRIGIVGAGFIGVKHAAAWALVQGVSVVGIAERDEKARLNLADSINASGYAELSEMIGSCNLDILDVCLPTKLHRFAVIAGLEAGLDVVVEKPFAMDEADMDAMIAAQKKTGRRLMVAQVCRFKPENIYARKVIDEARFGKPLFFSAWRESETPTWSAGNWLQDKSKSGGTVMDLSIHDIDLANWFLGTPVEFSAREVTKAGVGGLSHVVSSLGYKSGGRASIEAGHLMPAGYPFNTGYRLVFERGAVECFYKSKGESYIDAYHENGSEHLPFAALPPILGGNAYAEELKHFVECLKSKKPFRISLEEAKAAVLTAKALSDSLPVGKTP